MCFSDLDFSTLQDIPPTGRFHDTPRVSVSAAGRVAMNRAFCKLAAGQREFRAKISPDGRYLVLCPDEPPSIRFSAKGGDAVHSMLAQRLEGLGFLVPVQYTMEWSEERRAWMGCCRELAQPPALSELEKPAKKPGGRRK